MIQTKQTKFGVVRASAVSAAVACGLALAGCASTPGNPQRTPVLPPAGTVMTPSSQTQLSAHKKSSSTASREDKDNGNWGSLANISGTVEPGIGW